MRCELLWLALHGLGAALGHPTDSVGSRGSLTSSPAYRLWCIPRDTRSQCRRPGSPPERGPGWAPVAADSGSAKPRPIVSLVTHARPVIRPASRVHHQAVLYCKTSWVHRGEGCHARHDGASRLAAESGCARVSCSPGGSPEDGDAPGPSALGAAKRRFSSARVLLERTAEQRHDLHHPASSRRGFPLSWSHPWYERPLQAKKPEPLPSRRQ